MGKIDVEKINNDNIYDRHGIAFSDVLKKRKGNFYPAPIDDKKPYVYGNKKGGHGYKITEDVVNNLERAFMDGASNIEACTRAGISRTIFYRWLKENPDFADHIEELRSIPTGKARQNIVDSIKDGNIDSSRWYLERKAREEFGNKAEIGINASVGYGLDDTEKAVETIIKRYLETMQSAQSLPINE